MRAHIFRQISCLMVAGCCLMLFFSGCSRSGEGAGSLADKKEGTQEPIYQ